MPWHIFVFWNALGGIAWATSIGLLAYLLGPTAEGIIKDVGIAGIAIAVLAIIGYIVWRRTRRAD
jgi:membrane protein DedA with SNARE-associated domain